MSAAPMQSEDTPLYDAFLSYRHVEPDRSWARWLHRALETWRTPRRLVVQGVPARLDRVFRDEDELPASASLSESIERALRQSRYLIVVCSPRTPESQWVRAEIARFREWGRHDAILALLVEGEPDAAFPPELRRIERRVARDPEEPPVSGEVEPLAADARARPGEPLRSLRNAARLRLLAVLLGCRYDDLVRRHEERRRRVRTVFATAALLLAALLGTTAVYALTQRNVAEARRLEAEESAASARRSQYASDVSLADGLIERGLSARARSVLEGTDAPQRQFEFHHLWARVDPAIRRWRVPGSVLDVWDQDEDGTPELILTTGGVVRLTTQEPVVVLGEGVSAGRFVGGAEWLLLERGREGRRRVELLHIGSGRLTDLSARAQGGVAGAPHAPLVAFEGAAESPPGGASRLFVLDLLDGSEVSFDLPRDALRLAFQGRLLVCVPHPGGTLRVPGDPMLIDLDSGEVRSLDGDLEEGDVDVTGSHHAYALDAVRVVYAVNRNLGLYEVEQAEGGGEGDRTRKRPVSRHPYPIEGVVADPGSFWFAAWDEGGNVRWYGMGAGSDAIAELFAYGAPAPVGCVVPTRSGTWTFVGDVRGGIAAFQTGPTGTVLQAPDWGGSRLSFDMGSNYGWTARLRLDPLRPVVEILEFGRWLSGVDQEAKAGVLDLASGKRREAPRPVGADEPLLFRLSSTEMGWDDLSEPAWKPEQGMLPVYLERERRVERREVPPGTRSFAVSSDGLAVAFQGEDGTVSLAAGSRTRTLAVGTHEVLAGLASEGRFLATFEPDESAFLLYRVGAASAPRRIAVESLREARRGRGVSFSPGGERMACWIDPATIGVFDTANSRMVLSLDVSPSYPGGDVRFSPDGHLLWTKRSARNSSLGRDTEIVLWIAGTPLQIAHGVRPAPLPR
ncbi:MAG: toll/interleukin-1 receptor domain-containing protein [Planctomycetaceae bacterium]